MTVLAADPITYGFGGCSNKSLSDMKVDLQSPLSIKFKTDILDVILGEGKLLGNKKQSFEAIL